MRDAIARYIVSRPGLMFPKPPKKASPLRTLWLCALRRMRCFRPDTRVEFRSGSGKDKRPSWPCARSRHSGIIPFQSGRLADYSTETPGLSLAKIWQSSELAVTRPESLLQLDECILSVLSGHFPIYGVSGQTNAPIAFKLQSELRFSHHGASRRTEDPHRPNARRKARFGPNEPRKHPASSCSKSDGRKDGATL